MRNSYLAGLGLSAVAALGLPLAFGAPASAASLSAAQKPAHVVVHAKAHTSSTHAKTADTHQSGRVTKGAAHATDSAHAAHSQPATHGTSAAHSQHSTNAKPAKHAAPAEHAKHSTHRAHASQALTYTVKPGDSLWKIAHEYNVNWYNLAADSHITMYDVIVPGQVLHLPAKGEAQHAPMPLNPPHAAAPAPAPAAPAEAPAPTESAPAPTSEPSYSAPTGGFEQCVISRESGGNPDVTNASGHWGLFQFSASTWSAYGGNPGDFGSASAGEQEQVFNNAMAAGGEDNWAPYDGC